MNDALPAFLTIILMPLTYSITNGMIFGLLASAGFYFTTGQVWSDAKTLHRSMNCLTVGTTLSEAEEDESFLGSHQNEPNGEQVSSSKYGSFV